MAGTKGIGRLIKLIIGHVQRLALEGVKVRAQSAGCSIVRSRGRLLASKDRLYSTLNVLTSLLRPLKAPFILAEGRVRRQRLKPSVPTSSARHRCCPARLGMSRSACKATALAPSQPFLVSRWTRGVHVPYWVETIFQSREETEKLKPKQVVGRF